MIAAAALLVTGIAALIKWLTRDTEAFKQQSEAVEELAGAQENLQQSTNSSAKSHQDNVKSLKAEADASKNWLHRSRSCRKRKQIRSRQGPAEVLCGAA